MKQLIQAFAEDIKSPGEEYIADFIAKARAYMDDNAPKIDVRLFDNVCDITFPLLCFSNIANFHRVMHEKCKYKSPTLKT